MEPSRKPPAGEALVVLLPKPAWRLLLPALLVFFAAVMAGLIDGGDGASLWGWVLIVMLALGSAAAWRSRIELHPGVIYRRGPVRWSHRILASEIEEVALHDDWMVNDYPHRVLTLTTYDRRELEISLRWWRRWWKVIGWLATYCTRTDDGEDVWAVRTDQKTRDRLEPYAQRLPSAEDSFPDRQDQGAAGGVP
jgi:hypothetical protein